MFQSLESFVAGHEKPGFAGFRQCEQIAILGIRRDRAGWQVLTEQREVPKACCEQFSRAGTKPSLEEGPSGDVAEFRNKRVTGDERE